MITASTWNVFTNDYSHTHTHTHLIVVIWTHTL